MATQRFILTRQGYEQLKAELSDLEARRRERLEQLRDYKDDVGENPNEEGAFFEAETMREHVEERIGHLQLVLQEAEIVDDDPNPQTADPGDRVTVWDVDMREELTFDLIGSTEATYLREGVSVDSPVGQALIGKRIGETVEVNTPDGRAQYVIRRLERIPSA